MAGMSCDHMIQLTMLTITLAPAFTSVSARRAFGGSTYTSNTSQPLPPPSKKITTFPPAVREYVQRCFDSKNSIPGITAEDMQTKLKEVINSAAAGDGLDSTNWAVLPLPQAMIGKDRQRLNSVPQPVMQHLISDPRLVDSTLPPTNKTSAKKRKSYEMMNDTQAPEISTAPPWHNANAASVFESRITHAPQTFPQQVTRAEKRQRKQKEQAIALDSDRTFTDLEKRRQRFGLGPNEVDISTLDVNRSHNPTPADIQGPVVGLCQTLEKRYFRLTSAPKPETVRPQPILEKTLELLKKKWKTDYNYSYICDQFKSMRQDLTVQHIKNAFTVSVYETHAHIALQNGDLGEYNQCQTQLRALYKLRIGGRPAEFLAYRILYFIYTGNRTDMNDALAHITPADRQVPAVKHALNVRSALALGNYHRFFRLYLDAPNMGPYLMDKFIARERLAALANISRS